MFVLEINNIDDLIKKFWNLDTKNAIRGWLNKVLLLAERNAKIETPVDTWFLRNWYESFSSFQNYESTLRNIREYADDVRVKWNPSQKNLYMERATEKTEERAQAIFIKTIDQLLYNLR